jgi:hypothetical protein
MGTRLDASRTVTFSDDTATAVHAMGDSPPHPVRTDAAKIATRRTFIVRA